MTARSQRDRFHPVWYGTSRFVIKAWAEHMRLFDDPIRQTFVHIKVLNGDDGNLEVRARVCACAHATVGVALSSGYLSSGGLCTMCTGYVLRLQHPAV